jgi:hypothetical protein
MPDLSINMSLEGKSLKLETADDQSLKKLELAEFFS